MSSSAVNICFYGLNRSLSSTIRSINKYLFDGLSSLGIDYKIYGTFSRVNEFANERSSESAASIQANEEDLINFSEINYVDQDTFDDSISWEEVFEFGDLYSQISGDSDFRKKDSSAKNIFRSLWCLKSSYSLVPEERRKLPTIFVRPDLEILSEIHWSFYLGLMTKKPREYAFGQTDGVALVPGWHSWDGLNDRFALCSSGNASSAYANRFDGLLPYIKMSRHPVHPESYLLHILQASRVEVLPVISTCMSRMRANGESQAEDFAQGAKIYSLQTETLSCLHKLLRERTEEADKLRQDQFEWTAAQSELLRLKEDCRRLSEEFTADKSELLARIKILERDIVEIEENYHDSKITADLTLTQLVRVQEELEHYYLMSRQLMLMIKNCSNLESRSIRIISKLI